MTGVQTCALPISRRQFEELLFFFTAEAYPEAAKSWYSLAGRIEESKVSSVFYVEKVSVKNNGIEIFGNLRQYADTALIENISRTYRIDYQVRDGRFEVISFKEKSSSEGEKGK